MLFGSESLSLTRRFRLKVLCAFLTRGDVARLMVRKNLLRCGILLRLEQISIEYFFHLVIAHIQGIVMTDDEGSFSDSTRDIFLKVIGIGSDLSPSCTDAV